jgi:hypothetical protein
MIGISEDCLHKLWGQPIYNFKEESNESVVSYLREQELSSTDPRGGNKLN